MSYGNDLKKHLAVYRCSDLGIVEPGVFRYRGRDVVCEHILPLSQAWLNLLPAASGPVQLFLGNNPKVKRHKYFHHLNSSQAFAFNLFFPYFNGGSLASAALLRALGQQGSLRDWAPEVIPAPKEGTNIDVTWSTTDGLRAFCEVKLSESDLGKAAIDDKHRRKLRDIYRPVLDGFVDPLLLESPAFFNSYQFVRNVWHLVRTENSRLVFLLPRANRAVWKILETLIPRVSETERARISRVAIEDVLAALGNDPGCSVELREYATLLARKYVPI